VLDDVEARERAHALILERQREHAADARPEVRDVGLERSDVDVRDLREARAVRDEAVHP
jgi:hypothetical protein